MYWLTDKQKATIKEKAVKNLEEETCGFILENDEVIEVPNTHEERKNNFRIDSSEIIKYEEYGIKGIWHTHLTEENFSPKDQTVMRSDTLPWAIYCIATNKFTEADFSKTAPFIGRPFIYGIWDCYALVRDYLAEIDIELPDWKRGAYGEWEEPTFREFDNNWVNYDMIPINDKHYQKYDIACMNLGNTPNHIDHIGIFSDNRKTLLHHPADRRSRHNRWSQWLEQRTILVLRPAKLWNSKP